jgi:polysaccharide biosynthesis transport protein
MEEEFSSMSIQDVVAILKRRTWSLVLPAIIVFAIAAVVAFKLPRTYRSTSTILIEEQGMPRNFVASMVTGYADQRLQIITQRVMISSRLLDIVNKFNLYPDKRKKMTTEEILALIRKDIAFNTIDAADSRSGGPATIAFSLSYDGEKPAIVQQITATLASLYLEENLKFREEQSTGTHKFLEDEAQELKEQISKIDAGISAFKKKNMDALPELLATNLQTLERTERDIDQKSNDLGTLRERESEFQSQLASIPTEAENQDKTRLRELKARLAQNESRYSNEHPDVIKTRAEIAKLEAQMGYKSAEKSGPEKPDNPAYLTLASQIAGIRSEINSAKRQIEDLRRKRDEYQRRVEATPKIDEVLKTLTADRSNTQAKYDDLMRKALDAKISQGLEREQMGERFILIEPARLPQKPIKPNVPAILMIGLVLGIGAGVGVAAIREFSNRSIRSAHVLAKETALPVLGSIPEIVTWGDLKRQRIKRVVLAIGMFAVIAGVIVVFHFYVMDLDVLWIRILRRFDR